MTVRWGLVCLLVVGAACSAGALGPGGDGAGAGGNGGGGAGGPDGGPAAGHGGASIAGAAGTAGLPMAGTGGAAAGTGGAGTGGAAGGGGTSGAAGGASGIAGTGGASVGGTGGAAGGPAGRGGTTGGPFGKLSFLAPVNYPAGRAATAGTDVADLNGDGWPDVVTGGLGINILLNNKDGTLAAPVTYRATTTFGSVACGDMNGDGKPDILAADATSVSVFMNAGNGTFAAAPITHPIDTGSSGSSYLSTIALGDVNGDGKLDVAAAVNASIALDGDGKVSVHLNDGTGRLTQAFNRTTDAGLVSIAIGDLNGDGKPDLAAVGDSPGAVDALVNTGNTTSPRPSAG